MARPTVFDEFTLQKLEAAFLLGCTDAEACFAAGIAASSLYNYQKENPEFLERKELLKNNPVYIARQTVVKEIAEKGDLALKFLERKKKDEFGSSTNINLGGQEDNPVVTRIERVIIDNAENTDS